MASRRRKTKKICKECNKQFHPLYVGKGVYCSIDCMALNRTGAAHPNWKGDVITYEQIHWWNNKYYKKKGACTQCKVKRKTEWALIKGKKHKRGIENYIELCRKCHINYDMTEEWVGKSKKALEQTYTHQNPIKPKACGQCNENFMPRRKTSRYCSNSCSAKARPAPKRKRDGVTGQWLALNKKE